MTVENHRTWKKFKDFQNGRSLRNCIVMTTKSVDPSQSFHNNTGRFTMGGVGFGFNVHKNITDIIIPAFTVGYLEKINIGGSLVQFSKKLSPEQAERNKTAVTIQLLTEHNDNRISIMLSNNDIENLLILTQK